jgi:hypothetical protein
MTTSTPILGLTLYNSTTDQAEFFSNFRAVIAGVSSSSNFYKIDTAYGVQAAQITALQNTKGSVYVPCTFVSANYYEANGITLITSLITDMTIVTKFDVASAGTVTLNINSLGTKSVMKVNGSGTIVNIAAGELMIGKNYLFRYDGTQWVWVGSQSADQIYISGTSGNVVLINSDNTLTSTTPSLVLSGTIHAATEKTSLADADEIGIVDSADSNILKRITWANVKTVIITALGTLIAALTAKTTPVDGDSFVLSDSEATAATKKVLFSALKATLVTYFDTLYLTISGIQTITGAKTFGTIGGTVGKLILAGSTSGSTILNASATAGSTTVVLPAANDTLVGLATTDTLTNKRITKRVGSTTSHATPTINTDNYDAYSITAQAEAITSMTTNLSGTPTNFQNLLIRIKDNGTARAITWGTSFQSGSATLPTTTVLSKALMVGLIYDSVDAKWTCEATGSRA